MAEVLPKIEVISMWYNESFLTPFYLKHYSFADKIRIAVDADTNDGCEEIIKQYPNTSIESFKFPALADCQLHIERINAMYRESSADWVIFADADEFIFCDNFHNYLADNRNDVIYARLYQVYRNINDRDLDSTKPVLGQRMCGDPFLIKGQNRHGKKPLVVRAKLPRMKWMPGAHNIWNRYKYKTSEDVLPGQHWIMADPCFCVKRRVERGERQSEVNKATGMACHNNDVTAEKVLAECKLHENDGEINILDGIKSS